MTEVQYNEARETFLAMLQRQPNLIKESYPSETAGIDLAITAWAFIEEFEKQRKAKVTG